MKLRIIDPEDEGVLTFKTEISIWIEAGKGEASLVITKDLFSIFSQMSDWLLKFPSQGLFDVSS